MNIQDAIELLQSNNVRVLRKQANYIAGGKRVENIEKHGEELVRIHNPYSIENIDGIWITSVDIGQRVLPIKVSKSLEEVTWAIINIFNMAEKQSDDVYMFLDALIKLILNNFIVEVISQTDIAVYAGGSGFDDHFKKYGLALTSAAFKENSLVAVIQTKDQGLVVRFGLSDQLVTTETVSNIEAAANLIIDRQEE